MPEPPAVRIQAVRHSWRFYALVTAGSCLVILAALLGRTLGIQFDEANYLAWAIDMPLGDAAPRGKPYIFFLLNYGLYRLLPSSLEAFRPLTIPVVYAVVNVVAVVVLARVAANGRALIWYLVILVGSPFFIFNSTQVMMETAVVPCLTLAMAGLITMERGDTGSTVRLLVLVSAMLAVLIKETAAPAVGIMAIAFWPRLHARLWPLAAAIVGGVGLTKILMTAIDASPHEYGGLSSFLHPGAVWLRLPLTWDYFWTWTFFVGPFTLAVVCVQRFWRGELQRPEDLVLWRLGGLSLLATFGMQLASNLPYPRYAYPIIWIGLIAFAFLLLRGPRWLAAFAIALSLVPVANLWSANTNQMRLWPRFVANDSLNTFGTVLPGVPNYGWVAFTSPSRRANCIFFTEGRAEGPGVVRQFMRTVTPNARWFDEAQLDEFRQCVGPKAIIWRQYQDVPERCEPECPASTFSVTGCTVQRIRPGNTPGGLVTNRTCLP